MYHGWKFDVRGNCMEMPTEPPGFAYKDRMKLGSYSVREAGGIAWTYLGPREAEPSFPEYDWMKLPAEQRAVFKVGERANYLQALEGAIDSAHSWFLHQDTIWDWKKRASISTDTSPKLETEDTAYGMRYAAIRRTPSIMEAFGASRRLFLSINRGKVSAPMRENMRPSTGDSYTR